MGWLLKGTLELQFEQNKSFVDQSNKAEVLTKFATPSYGHFLFSH